ncbi:hypothetical protein NIES4071_18110 [Calothrix sp. NIES-4071]|nr:hypothetical protein NIES4071_18110 [Calothrix sp. NIES-4071]BAZ56144.1 hypothetical protein NIES4105_18060 [Calothrix sp. NIES-4105]
MYTALIIILQPLPTIVDTKIIPTVEQSNYLYSSSVVINTKQIAEVTVKHFQ